MNPLLIKLILMPLVITFVTLASRKWGNSIAGILGSLPWVAGPIILFIAIEQGKSFAIQSISGVMVGIIGWLVFCVVYILVGRRFNALISLFVGYLAYFLVGILLNPFLHLLTVNQWLGVCIFILIMGLKYFPEIEKKNEGRSKVLRFEILLRMLVITSFVVVITYFADILGPNWSGILTPFPIMTAVLAIFTHYTQGIYQVRRIYMGLFTGMFGFTLFLFLQAILLPHTSIFWAFVAGIIVDILITLLMKRLFGRFGIL